MQKALPQLFALGKKVRIPFRVSFAALGRIVNFLCQKNSKATFPCFELERIRSTLRTLFSVRGKRVMNRCWHRVEFVLCKRCKIASKIDHLAAAVETLL